VDNPGFPHLSTVVWRKRVLVKLESVIQYADAYLGVAGHPDYRQALNGLQMARPAGPPVRLLCAAVDASEAVITDAVSQEADLLIVHHGLFWGGLRSWTGPLYRKVRALVQADLAVYAAHLPLDAHPEVGNCILLARAVGLDVDGRFGRFEGADIGWSGVFDPPLDRDALRARLAGALDGPVAVIPGSDGPIGRVAVLTGSGGSFIEDAVQAGADALITGEGAHHTYAEAMERGVDVFYAGHYATETFGVKALCAHLAERFGLEWRFLDHPTGM
jgi:dinuclear metal center YbgI/SA1388 family protein